MMNEKRNKTYPWLVVLCCCGLATASLAITVNAGGIFFTPVAKALNVGIGQVSLFLTIMNLTSGFVGPLTVKLFKRFDLRLVIGAGAALAALCYVGLSRITAIWQMYVLALILGLANTCFGIVVVSLIVGNWFYKHSGLAMGIAMSFSGVMGAVLSPVFNALIENFGWRTTYVWTAAIVVVATLPTVLFARLHPKDMGLIQYGADEKAEAKQETAAKADTPQSKGLGMLICLCVIALLCAFVTGMGSHMAGYASSIGLTSSTGALMLSMTMIGNSSSKMIMGTLCDMIGPRRACTLMLSVSALGFVLLSFLHGTGTWVMMLAALLVGAVYSYTGVGLSIMTRDILGNEDFATSYSYVTTMSFLGSAVAYTIIGFSYDTFGSYVPATIGCLTLVVISMLGITITYRMKKAQQQ